MHKKYKIITLFEAILDLKEAKKWYKEQSPSALKSFIKAYENATNSLKTQPYRTPQRNTYNIFILDNFPYLIFYTVDEITKTVIITAVFNSNQNISKYPS
jgi:plasmid stabilization system protein ParE